MYSYLNEFNPLEGQEDPHSQYVYIQYQIKASHTVFSSHHLTILKYFTKYFSYLIVCYNPFLLHIEIHFLLHLPVVGRPIVVWCWCSWGVVMMWCVVWCCGVVVCMMVYSCVCWLTLTDTVWGGWARELTAEAGRSLPGLESPHLCRGEAAHSLMVNTRPGEQRRHQNNIYKYINCWSTV